MRVTVTIPAYLEQQFEQLCTDLNFSRQDTLLHCFAHTLACDASAPQPEDFQPKDDTPDLYMVAAPERLKVYTFSDAGTCLRGEEIGELHEIERGDKYAWVKFSRHSKKSADGWENGKNGKLCETCHGISTERWKSELTSFE